MGQSVSDLTVNLILLGALVGLGVALGWLLAPRD